MIDRRHNVNDIRKDKCIEVIPTHFLAHNSAPALLERKWATWGRFKERSKARATKCITSPQAIIRAVFPDSTEGAALSVAYCETGGTFNIYAHNPSGASGLFQLMPIHWQGKFDPYNPWANSRYALRLSYGGTSWGAWVCQP